MRIRLRTSKVSIETPKIDSEPWVHITVQQVIEDDNGKILNIIPRYNYISKPLSEIAMDIDTFIDPVLQKENSISGAGMATALTIIISKWINNEHNGTILPDGSIAISE